MIDTTKRIKMLKRAVEELEKKNDGLMAENKSLKNKLEQHERIMISVESYLDNLKEISELRKTYTELIEECKKEKEKYSAKMEEFLKSNKR